jgi:hypothetical protein
MNRRRLLALERLLGAEGGEPTVQAVLADGQRLDQRLASLGRTARQALAAGLTEPPELGLRWTSLARKVEAQDRADAYRRQAPSRPRRTNLLGLAQKQAQALCPK